MDSWPKLKNGQRRGLKSQQLGFCGPACSRKRLQVRWICNRAVHSAAAMLMATGQKSRHASMVWRCFPMFKEGQWNMQDVNCCCFEDLLCSQQKSAPVWNLQTQPPVWCRWGTSLDRGPGHKPSCTCQAPHPARWSDQRVAFNQVPKLHSESSGPAALQKHLSAHATNRVHTLAHVCAACSELYDYILYLLLITYY